MNKKYQIKYKFHGKKTEFFLFPSLTPPQNFTFFGDFKC